LGREECRPWISEEMISAEGDTDRDAGVFHSLYVYFRPYIPISDTEVSTELPVRVGSFSSLTDPTHLTKKSNVEGIRESLRHMESERQT
jgi:hypothetical protein